MRTFYEYVENKTFNQTLAACLVEANAVEFFCNETLEMAKTNTLNEELLNELLRNILGGASNLAQGAAGLFGGLGRFAGNKAAAGGRAIGNAAAAGGRAIGNAAAAGGRWVGDKAAQAGQAVGNQLNQAGQYMNQSKQAEAMRQAVNSIGGLQKQLAGMGIPEEWLQRTLAPLAQAIQQEIEGNKQLGYKVGSSPEQYDNHTAPRTLQQNQGWNGSATG